MFAGATIVGGSVSTTVTACVAAAELPAAAVAVGVTAVVPGGEGVPEGGLDVGAAAAAMAEAWPGSVLRVMFAGQVMVGGSRSSGGDDTTVKLAAEFRPTASTAFTA